MRADTRLRNFSFVATRTFACVIPFLIFVRSVRAEEPIAKAPAPSVSAESLTRTHSFAVVSDAGEINKNTESIIKSIKAANVKSLVMAGDNLYESTYEKIWKPWSDSGLKFDVVAIGNHTAGYGKEVRFFKMPGEYYSNRIGTLIRFIVLNSDNEKNVPEQMKFLERELKTASEKFVFLVYHHPTYTVSSYHKWQEKTAFQSALRPLLKTYRKKITSLIVGHDHLALVAQFDDLPVILSGAAQDVRTDTPISNTQDGVKVETLWYFNHTPHWARLDIDDDKDGAQFHFIEAKTGKRTCSVEIRTGQSPGLKENCKTKTP